MTRREATDYCYGPRSQLGHHSVYILPTVLKILTQERATRVFDLGCGDGSTAAFLAARGFAVTGVDPSRDGISAARRSYPALRLDVGSAYEPLAQTYGSFPVVISLEVVEHVYAPREFAKCLFSLVEP